jgi:hypothetical protein
MAYNLARNSRVFVTTNLSTAVGATVASGQTNAPVGCVLTTGFTTANTWEIQVLDGFKFSQATATTDVSINEAGAAPTRGKRTFNTALNPVDISFSTYIRPRLASNIATAEERVLWNALVGSVGIDGTVQSASTLAALVTTTTGTMTRASTTASIVTLVACTMTAAPVAGSVYHIKGATTASTLPWYGPIKVTSFASTTLIGEYLTAPPSTAGTTSPSMAGMTLSLAAWNEYPTNTAVTTSAAVLTTGMSNKNQMQSLGFLFLVDNTVYVVDNCAMDQAQIDFGLDAISMIAWTAKGTQLNQIDTFPTISTAANPVFSGSLTGTAAGKSTTANYITNKLSTVTLQSNLGGIGGTSYTVALTGGSVTIANNINYVTPANIGQVNIPIGYFTGARAVSGTLNAYLRTGTGQAADLLDTLLLNITSAAETKYRLQLEIGGSTAGTRVELDMPGTVIGIPSIDVADVVSTTIAFSAQGTTTDIAGTANGYNIENTNDLTVRYYSV